MTGVPQWLQDEAEIAATMYELRQMHEHVARRSPLDVAIDQATGYEAKLRADAEAMMARVDELRGRAAAGGDGDTP